MTKSPEEFLPHVQEFYMFTTLVLTQAQNMSLLGLFQCDLCTGCSVKA